MRLLVATLGLLCSLPPPSADAADWTQHEPEKIGEVVERGSRRQVTRGVVTLKFQDDSPTPRFAEREIEFRTFEQLRFRITEEQLSLGELDDVRASGTTVPGMVRPRREKLLNDAVEAMSRYCRLVALQRLSPTVTSDLKLADTDPLFPGAPASLTVAQAKTDLLNTVAAAMTNRNRVNAALDSLPQCGIGP